MENLALACQECNNRKFTSVTTIDPLNGDSVPLFNPRRDGWSEHFSWNEDYTLLVGLTPVGRTTLEKLRLNRASLVNFRRILHIAGIHPLPEDD